MPPVDDHEVWQTYACGVKKTATRKAARVSRKERVVQQGLASQQTTRVQPSLSRDKDIKREFTIPSQLDRRTERRLRQGDIVIEARLDLHGLTQSQAFTALLRFVDQRVAEGKRRLLVITGKGFQGKSVLRQNVPKWLSGDPRLATRILALRQAMPKHGGEGAWYIILRKDRSGKDHGRGAG